MQNHNFILSYPVNPVMQLSWGPLRRPGAHASGCCTWQDLVTDGLQRITLSRIRDPSTRPKRNLRVFPMTFITGSASGEGEEFLMASAFTEAIQTGRITPKRKIIQVEKMIFLVELNMAMTSLCNKIGNEHRKKRCFCHTLSLYGKSGKNCDSHFENFWTAARKKNISRGNVVKITGVGEENDNRFVWSILYFENVSPFSFKISLEWLAFLPGIRLRTARRH